MKILILQTAFIGDVVLATPLIEAVKWKYTGAEIYFLTIPYSAPILRHHPGLKEILILDKRGKHSWRRTLEMARRLKKEKFDLALVPHRSLRSAALVKFAAIPRRIGFDRSAGSFWLTDIVKYRQDSPEVKRNLSLLGMEKEEIPPAIYPGVSETEEACIILEEFGIKGDFLAIAPGSIWNTKRWLAEHFRELIRLFKQKGLPPIVLVGSKNESGLCEEIAAGYEGYAHITAGRLDPLESAALLSRAEALVANDSAAGHIAAAAGTKVLTIFGPSVPAFGFAPYGEGHRIAEHSDLYCRPCRIHGSIKCPEKHFRCMKELTPEAVFKELSAMIKK